ncbi:hypothetical protein MSPP1_000531 [Malassezia sp. CBS 17886]|nr:hypothetical protein MSPP1_000531 [Malassezia sp. CBS 17886]
MSLQSSVSASRRGLTDGDVYVFALQTAYLAYLVATAGAAAAAPEPPAAEPVAARAVVRHAHERTGEAARLNIASLADRMRELRVNALSSRARYPEKLVRKLCERLERIAMGRDAQYSQPLFRQTVGSYYGTLGDPATQKRLRENRSIEEIILLFISSAQAVLKKHIAADAERKQELDVAVSLFADILRDTLRSIAGVPRELVERVDEYVTLMGGGGRGSKGAGGPGGAGGAKLPASPPPPPLAASRLPSSPPAPPPAGAAKLPAAPPASPPPPPGAAVDFPAVRAVAALFAVGDEQLALDVSSVRSTATLVAGMVDLKRCVFRINTQAAWPAAPDDFVSPEEYRRWKSAELSRLSQLMVELCRANPSLLSSPSAADSTSKGARRERRASVALPDAAPVAALTGDEGAMDDEFTYIPPDVSAAYQRLLEKCLDADLEAIRNKTGDEEVSLTVLSAAHADLLATIATWWRVPEPLPPLALLRVMKTKFDTDEVPLECVSEALQSVERLLADADAATWRIQERRLLARTLDALTDTLLRTVYAHFQEPRATRDVELATAVALVEHVQRVRAAPALAAPAADRSARQIADLTEAVRLSAMQRYTAQTTELFAGGEPDLLHASLALARWVQHTAAAQRAQFPAPMLGVDAADTVAEKLVALYLDDLESLRAGILQQTALAADLDTVQTALALLGEVRALLALYAGTRAPLPLAFDVRRWFAPYVEQWMVLTERRAREWVQNAVQNDTFAPIDSEGAVHSSSINDLFDALQQPVQFLLGLQWPDAYENACFLTKITQATGRLVEQYCRLVEDLFMAEMAPPAAPEVPSALAGLLDGPLANRSLASLPPKQAAWVARARQTIAREKKVAPYVVQPESCVKLNNIEAARTLLDVVYQRIDADTQAEIVRAHERRSGAHTARAAPEHLFSLKLVQAELADVAQRAPAPGALGLPRMDTFVTLSDQRGERLAKTRTIYDTASPRWEEVFDLPVHAPMWVSATVWRREPNHSPLLYGRASVRLDAQYFGDRVPHELWLDLDKHAGKLLVRLSMQDAHDDILFHFGRAFRVLKRAEVDMARVIVDHMSLYMRQNLSRAAVKSLVRSGLNLDRAIGNVKALYASALAQANGTAAAIPPVERGKRGAEALTDPEIEAAIVPLLDYFEVTLGTLKGNLSDSGAQFVLTRVWKEVLQTLEAILVPPLSDAPSPMRQLSDKEVDIVFKWLSFLKSYFNAYDADTGVAHGLPLDQLQGPKYRELLSYLLLHDLSTDELMIECVRGFQARIAKTPERRAKSVLNQRSLGTIRKHKQNKAEDDQPNLTDMAMKILRMRPGTGDFLSQQLISMHSLSATQPKRSDTIFPSLRRMSKRLPPMPMGGMGKGDG